MQFNSVKRTAINVRLLASSSIAGAIPVDAAAATPAEDASSWTLGSLGSTYEEYEKSFFFVRTKNKKKFFFSVIAYIQRR